MARMTLNKKIGVAIATLSLFGAIGNLAIIFSSGEEVDRLLISTAYCAMCLLLSAISFICKDFIALIMHLCSIAVGSFLCFNTKDAYLYGAIIMSVGVIIAYSNGLFNKNPRRKLVTTSIFTWLFIAVACPEPFPTSAILAFGYTAFIAIFLYILFTILRDKIDQEKIVEKRMLNAIDESEVLLSEAMEIIKEMNRKMRQGGTDGRQ